MSSSPLDNAAVATRPVVDCQPDFDETAVGDAAYMMEALHGDRAAMLAVAIACDRMLEEKLGDVRFWMKVYRSLTAAKECELDPPAMVH